MIHSQYHSIIATARCVNKFNSICLLVGSRINSPAFANPPKRNIASGLVGIAQESDSVAPGLFSYETLKDGTAEFFNILPGSANLSADERKLSDDDIVTYFSNVVR